MSVERQLAEIWQAGIYASLRTHQPKDAEQRPREVPEKPLSDPFAG